MQVRKLPGQPEEPCVLCPLQNRVGGGSSQKEGWEMWETWTEMGGTPGAKQLMFQGFLGFAKVCRETGPKSIVVLPCRDLLNGEFSSSFLHPELDFCCPWIHSALPEFKVKNHVLEVGGAYTVQTGGLEDVHCFSHMLISEFWQLKKGHSLKDTLCHWEMKAIIRKWFNSHPKCCG